MLSERIFPVVGLIMSPHPQWPHVLEPFALETAEGLHLLPLLLPEVEAEEAGGTAVMEFFNGPILLDKTNPAMRVRITECRGTLARRLARSRRPIPEEPPIRFG